MSHPELQDVDTIIATATGEIDRELLTGTGTGGLITPGYFNDGPLTVHLNPADTLEYLVENHASGLEIDWAAESETITPAGDYRTAALITDTVTRVVIGQTNEDRVIEIPHQRVTDTATESSLLRQTLTLTTDEATYRLATTNTADVDAIATYILNQGAASDTTDPEVPPSEESNTTQPEKSDQPSDGGQPADEESIADSDGVTTNGHWQLPTADTLSALDSGPAASLETARDTLADTPQPTREQLIRAHSDLCAALAYIPPERSGIREAVDAVIDRVETELIERHTNQPSVTSSTTSDDSTAIPGTQTDHGEDGQEDAATSDSEGDIPSHGSAATDTDQRAIQPNELSELYEAFGMLQAVIDQLIPHLDPQTQSATQDWYEAIYQYWTGAGPDGAPSYGDQQRERNDFSINDYREAYGDGNRITAFQTIETKTIEDVTHDELGALDLAVDASGIVPITPESNTPLPVLVRNGMERDTALDRLAEFPAYPEANTLEPTTTPTDELPEGRVDEVTVTVLNEYSGTGEKRDAWLSVQTDTGQRMPLVIWTTHDIDADWEVGATYTLYDARHKQWSDDEGATTHELSSTSDLTIVQTGDPESPTEDTRGTPSSASRQPPLEDDQEEATERDETVASTEESSTRQDSTGSTPADPPEPTAGSDAGDDDEEEEPDEPKDIVDRVLNDIDL